MMITSLSFKITVILRWFQYSWLWRFIAIVFMTANMLSDLLDSLFMTAIFNAEEIDVELKLQLKGSYSISFFCKNR